MSLKKIKTPTWPARMLEWYCGADLAEDLLGDVDEIFYANLSKMSVFKARIKYWTQTLTLLFSYAVRSRKRNHTTLSGNPYSLAMFNNYSKIAIRSLGRQKTFSIINAICLSTGMSVGLLALSAFIDMKEVDDFQVNHDRIYRVITTVDDGSDKKTLASSSAPLAQQLMEEGTGIETVVQFNRDFNPEFVRDGNTAIPLSGYYVGSDFFSMFSFSLSEGNPATALTKPFSLVITQASAKKLFGNEKALGKVIEVKGLGDFEVTGVLNDYHRSHLLFDVLTSFNTIPALENKGILNNTGLQDWGPRTNYYTYVLFQEGKNPGDLNFLLNQLADTQNKKEGSTAKLGYSFQSLKAIPGSDHYNEIGLVWGYLTMGVFFVLSLLVLLPACFNYTNISIARALKRAKEIGLRKVSGGESKNILIQMVLETVILAVISLLGAILIFIAIRTEFMKMIVEGSRSFDFEISPLTFLAFFIFAIGVGIVAGIFPALYFSKLNPIETLRNSSASGKLSKVNVRKGLIVFQFALSLVFILGVGIMVKQYQYALNFDYGFQKENMLEIPINGANAEVLKTELSRHSEITEVAMSSSIPGSWQSSAAWVKISDQDDSSQVYQMFIDEQYINCLELKLLAGKNFTNSHSKNEEYIIVNEEFLKLFQIATTTEALDQAFIIDGDKTLRVLGVVKNFNHMPLREQISSFFFRYDPTKMAYIHAKLASNDITNTLARIEQTWNTVVPHQKFEAKFLDTELAESLLSFRSIMKIFGFLGAMAIIISCLGLLAVAISTSESRLKEMGIRKVMGATVPDLAVSLSKGFVKLIIIAIVIATPPTYLFFDQLFLRVHHFRTAIGFTEIGGSIFFLCILVLVTIGSQTLKVARVNPVDTLKSE